MVTRRSGQWHDKALIGDGRATVRASLFTDAMVAARHNPVLRVFHAHLIAAGEPKTVALVAVARKLPTILDAII